MNTDARTAVGATPDDEGYGIAAPAGGGGTRRTDGADPITTQLRPRHVRAARTHRELSPSASMLVVGSVSSDDLTPPIGHSVHTMGGAGLYAVLGAAAVVERPVILAGAIGSDIAVAAIECLRRRSVQPVLGAVIGPGLRFAIRYDSAWRAYYTVDGAAAEAAITYPMASSGCPHPAAVHLCPTGPPEIQLKLAAALRAEHGEQLPLSATTFAARIRSHRPTVIALWSLLDLLICNVQNLQLLTLRHNLHHALEWAIEVTGRRATCATDAARGAYLVTGGTFVKIHAYPSVTIDPTGAGESFAGALAAGNLAGHGLIAASAIAAAVASMTVGGFGVARLVQADPAEIARRAAALAGAASNGRGHGV